MATTITFEDLDAPENLAVVATSSATGLADGTYYYVVIATFSDSTNVICPIGGKSLISNEANVTITTGNKHATLTWDAVTGAGGYKVYRSTTSEGYQNYLNIALRDVDINVGGTCTWVDEGISFAGNNFYQNIAHGRLNVSQDNYETDVLSIVDLYNASIAGGWDIIEKIDQRTYSVKAFLNFTTNITWKDENKTIFLYDLFTTGALFLTLGIKLVNSSGGSTHYTDRGCELFFRTWHHSSGLWLPELWCYDSYLNSSDAYAPNSSGTDTSLSIVHLSWTKGEVLFSFINKMRYFEPQSIANCLMDKVLLTRCDVALGDGKGTFNNVFIDTTSRAFQTTTGTRIRTTNYIGNNIYHGDVLVIGSNWQVELVDSFPNVRIGYHSGTGADSFARDIKTFEFILVDEDENALENVNLIIKDKDGVERFNDFTNGSGEVEDEVYHREVTQDNAVQTIVDFNPFTFTFKKEGYETYETIVNITERMFETVTLKKAIPVMTTMDSRVAVKLDATNATLDRDKVVII
jgi:hypothetical protein